MGVKGREGTRGKKSAQRACLLTSYLLSFTELLRSMMGLSENQITLRNSINGIGKCSNQTSHVRPMA